MKWFPRVGVLHISKKQQVKKEPADSLYESIIVFPVFFTNRILQEEIKVAIYIGPEKWVVRSYLLQKEGWYWSWKRWHILFCLWEVHGAVLWLLLVQNLH